MLNKQILIFLCFVSFGLSGLKTSAQSKKIISTILNKTMFFETGQGITNVLKVINNDSLSNFNFNLIVAHPEGWRFLGNKFSNYTINPLDSIFLPIRIIPYGKVKGNTKYIINTYLFDSDDKLTVSSNYFFAKKPKDSKWEVKPLPSKLIYLKNGQNESSFSFNVKNKGTEEEDLVFKIIPNQLQKIIIVDSSGIPLKNLQTSFTINQGQDTTLHYRAKLIQRQRNFKRISNMEADLNNHKQRFNIYANSKQSIFFDSKKNVNTHIEMRHLPNSINDHEFSRPSFPLDINQFFANFGDLRPVSNTFVNGTTVLKNNARFYYRSQIFFGGGSRINPQNASLNLSYYTKNYSMHIGQVGGYGGISGRGIGGRYSFNKLTLRGHLGLAPSLFNPRGGSFGITTDFNPQGNISLTNHITTSFLSGVSTTNFFSVQPSFKTTSQNGNVRLILININSQNPSLPTTSNRLQVSASFSQVYLNKRARTTLSAFISPQIQGAFGSLGASTSNYSLSNSFRVNNKWSLTLNNNYTTRETINSTFTNFTFLNNQLKIQGQIKGISINPVIFYNFMTFYDKRYIVRGLNYSTSNTNIVNNSRTSFGFSFGDRKRITDSINYRSQPFFTGNISYSYRVWRALISYSRGAINMQGVNNVLGERENLFLSINHQYQFKNPRFLFENSLAFRSNIRNSITFNPQFYFFTKNNFRLYFSPGLFWYKTKKSNYQFVNNEIPQVTSTGSFLNFGIRKRVGIPKSKTENTYVSTKFLAFLDNNGNHKKDREESYLENIVISIGNQEILTNEKGEASLNYTLRDSLYNISIKSIDDLNGFFPYYFKDYITQKDTTINIPFVKGVNVYGEIYIDRDKNNQKFNTQFDLSNLRVSAFNGVDVYTLTDSKGKFSLYVPFGEYVISIDEDMLGNKFKCLENNFELTLDESTSSVFVTFYLVEKRKKITIKKF